MIDKITLQTTNKLAKEFYKRYNSKKIMEKHREKFINLLGGNKILDCGCGIGRDCREFAKLGFKVIGVDVSEEMLKLAKQETKKTNFYQMDMTNLTLDNDKFDGIWCCSSLYHTKKRYILGTLKLFNARLKKEGIIFITVKEGEGESYNNKNYFGELKKFYAYYRDYELTRLLSKAGFDVIYMEKEHKDQNWINIFARKNT